jgi:hypothetical protein
MTPDEFVNRAVGLPWARWRNDWLACDCFGLVVLWMSEVQGVDVGAVPKMDLADGVAVGRVRAGARLHGLDGIPAWCADPLRHLAGRLDAAAL